MLCNNKEVLPTAVRMDIPTSTNVSHSRLKRYIDKSPHRMCHLLAKDAEAALPELKSICAYIDNKLGMQTMAVGPLKKPSEALLKTQA